MKFMIRKIDYTQPWYPVVSEMAMCPQQPIAPCDGVFEAFDLGFAAWNPSRPAALRTVYSIGPNVWGAALGDDQHRIEVQLVQESEQGVVAC